MFFKTHSRINPQTGLLSIYYRLVENNRTSLGGISQRSIMGVGFMDDVSTEELHLIADGLNDRISGRIRLIEDSPKVQGYADHLYNRLIKEKRIDRVENHLSRKTCELFDLEDRIIIYNLTNSYYEDEMRKSALARFGRSREKRNDCPPVVPALVVNVEGFASVFKGVWILEKGASWRLPIVLIN